MEENNEERICEDCGRVLDPDEELVEALDYNGNVIMICKDCADSDYYRTCDDCGRLVHVDYTRYIEDSGETVCEDCLHEDYNYCDHCDSWFSGEAYETANGDTICENCRDNYYCVCDNCGGLFHEDDVHWDDDYCYCDDCYQESYDEEGIIDYHANGSWQTYKTGEDKEEPIYFGFELEVEPNGDYSSSSQKRTLEKVHNNIHCYTEHDGSLNYGGFEIVSHPQTYNYIMEQYSKYKEVLETLKENDYRSDAPSNCGLHFHVTAPSEYGSEKREEIIDRLWLIVETYKHELGELSRRNGKYGYCHFLSESYSSEKFKNLYRIKGLDKNGNRYLVINNTNNRTIEIRVFKGTLDIDTFYADLQFTKNLFELAYDTSIDINDIDWARLTEGEYISKYCEEHNIRTDRKIQDNSLDMITVENKLRRAISSLYKMGRNKIKEELKAISEDKKNIVSYEMRNKLDKLGNSVQLLKDLTYFMDYDNNVLAHINWGANCSQISSNVVQNFSDEKMLEKYNEISSLYRELTD